MALPLAVDLFPFPLIAALVLAAAPAGSSGNGSGPSQDRYTRLRLDMVRTQIAERGIRDEQVLAAMRTVPRHLFVEKRFAEDAYLDRPVPIEKGQTMSQPYIVALMTELAEIKPGDRVLEIGTGSGYQAAVLASITEEVYTIEIIEELAERAAETLNKLGFEKVHTRRGDGYLGWPEAAPFDSILVTSAAEKTPPPLIEQLRPGGRIVIPIGKRSRPQILTLVRKTPEGKIEIHEVTGVAFVPLTRDE